MNRRFFSQSMGSAAVLSTLPAATARESVARFYRFDHLYFRQGSQGDRLNEFLASQVPLLAKVTAALGVFTAVVGPHLPALTVLSGFSDIQEMEAVDARIRLDDGYRRALQKLELGSEPPYDRWDRVLLRATDFSPAIVPLQTPRKMPRVFELRMYHSPATRQHGCLHERLSAPDFGRLHRAGIRPMLFADGLSGPKLPNLACLIPFGSLADREKAWDAFHADPDGEKGTPCEVSLWQPTPSSPIQ